MLTPADVAYIRSEFVPLDELCRAAGRDPAQVREAIRARLLPAPPYPGIDHVPADYFDLPDAAEFRRTFTGPDPEGELAAYLDGTYLVCLRRATVANILRKEALVNLIRRMLEAPSPDDEGWRDRLHARIDELDALERPFSPDYDRTRFPRPPTRDELIAAPRSLYPRASAAPGGAARIR
jgi:hypothetical protein